GASWYGGGSAFIEWRTGGWADVLQPASYGSFRLSGQLTNQVSLNGYSSGAAGFVFWTDGSTERYRLADWHGSVSLSYVSPSGSEQEVASGSYSYSAGSTLRIEADSTQRTVNVFANNVLVFTYLETDSTRRTTGRVGMTGNFPDDASGYFSIENF